MGSEIRSCRRCPKCTGSSSASTQASPFTGSSLHGQLSVGWGGVRGRKGRAVIEGCPSRSTSSFSLYSVLFPASSPGPGWGHLPSLMKIHGLIFIFGVVSETVAHKTVPVSLPPPYPKPGEADRMTWLSALAEQGQLQGLKMGFFGGEVDVEVGLCCLRCALLAYWKVLQVSHNGGRALPLRRSTGQEVGTECGTPMLLT